MSPDFVSEAYERNTPTYPKILNIARATNLANLGGIEIY